ncbi:unnamed protein product [Prunus armeniaca]
MIFGTSKECISEDNMVRDMAWLGLMECASDTVGDGDRTAVEAVVSTNEELSKLLKEVETLQNSASAFSCEEEGDHDNDDDAGNKLELYKKWQFMGSYAAEAQGSKFLLGWASQRIYKGFTKDIQGFPTKSFSGGGEDENVIS